jgi:hypothetical protein
MPQASRTVLISSSLYTVEARGVLSMNRKEGMAVNGCRATGWFTRELCVSAIAGVGLLVAVLVYVCDTDVSLDTTVELLK